MGAVGATADDERGGDVVLAEIVERGDVGGVELDGAREAGLDLARQGEAGDGAGVARLHAVGAAQPQLAVAGQIARAACCGDSQFALLDGLVGLILCIEDAAQKLMRERVGGIGGKGRTKQVYGVIAAALLQGVVGGRRWPPARDRRLQSPRVALRRAAGRQRFGPPK